MNKNILSSLLFILTCAFIVACNGGKSDKEGDEQGDSVSTTVTAEQVANLNQDGAEKSVYGVTLDRAMNSIMVISEKGDTLDFEFSNVDDRTKFASSNIGDSVTVKYVTVHGEDSVTAIMRGKHL